MHGVWRCAAEAMKSELLSKFRFDRAPTATYDADAGDNQTEEGEELAGGDQPFAALGGGLFQNLDTGEVVSKHDFNLCAQRNALLLEDVR